MYLLCSYDHAYTCCVLERKIIPSKYKENIVHTYPHIFLRTQHLLYTNMERTNKPIAIPETSNNATKVLGMAVVIFLNPKMISIVTSAIPSSRGLVFFRALGSTLMVPQTDFAWSLANILFHSAHLLGLL